MANDQDQCSDIVAGDSREGTDAASGRAVLRGGVLGAGVKLAIAGLHLFKSSIEGALLFGGVRPVFLGADLSPALLAVGYIVRLEVAAQIFLGGAIGWLILIPVAPEIVAALAPDSASLMQATSPGFEEIPTERAWLVWSKGVRYIGVGAMAVGGLAALFRVRQGLVRAVSELKRGFSRTGHEDSLPDLPASQITLFSLAAVSIVTLLYWRFTGSLAMTALTTVIMIVASFFFVGVASYIVGLVGNSNSPVSGMTITAVLGTGALLWVFGFTGTQGMVATLGVAAIVCCAACTAGDVCNDLKTGSLVGATPRHQQKMQLAGVLVAALVMAPVLQLLHNAYGIGSRELAAPQASLFASLARGFFGDEVLPWGLVGLGAGLGVGVLVADGVLAKQGKNFRLHLMPIAVGLYLPFGIAVPIFAGGLIEWWGRRGRQNNPSGAADRGVLFSSGVVAGEALVGVGIALLAGFGLVGSPFGLPGGAISLFAAIFVLWIFWRETRRIPTSDG